MVLEHSLFLLPFSSSLPLIFPQLEITISKSVQCLLGAVHFCLIHLPRHLIALLQSTLISHALKKAQVHAPSFAFLSS